MIQKTKQDAGVKNAPPNRPSPTWPWKRNLAAWRKTKDKGRLAADRRALRAIFAEAAYVPVLKDALDWAKAHDIQFIVDHTTTAGGYYFLGSGVVAIARGPAYALNPEYAIGVIVHEIRHAWQDYYGMIATLPQESFQRYFTNTALVEADAEAYATLARKQHYAYKTAELYKKLGEKEDFISQGILRNARDSEEEIADPQDFLRASFAEWFSGWRNNHYGKAAANYAGYDLGLPRVKKPDYKFEYHPEERTGVSGCDPARTEDILRLGKGFDGVNYLAGTHADFWQKKINNSALCLKFFDAGRKKPFVAVNRIRKELLRQKLAKPQSKPLLP